MRLELLSTGVSGLGSGRSLKNTEHWNLSLFTLRNPFTWYNYLRWVIFRMEYLLFRHIEPCVLCEFCTGIGVAVEAREVAAGDMHLKTMPLAKGHCRRPTINVKCVDTTRFQQCLMFETVAIAAPDQPVADIVGSAIGIDIAQLDGEVGVGSAGRSVNYGFDIADYLEVLRQSGAGVD